VLPADAAVGAAAAVDCEMVLPLASLTVVVTEPSAFVTTVVTSALELELAPLDEPSALLDFDAPDLAVAFKVLIGAADAPALAILVMMVVLRLGNGMRSASCVPVRLYHPQINAD